MTNFEYIKNACPEELCKCLIGIINDGRKSMFYRSTTDGEFISYDAAVKDCMRWLMLERE